MGEFCFVQRLIKLPTPDVQVVGKGGSVEADGTGIFYTHYTYYYTLYPLSVFSSAKTLQLIKFGNPARNVQFSYLSASR